MVDLAGLLPGLVDDLVAEHADLDGVVTGLAPDRWDEMTPATPWTVRDQISHLAFFDEQGALAAADPQGFLQSLATVSDAGAFMNGPLEKGRSRAVSELLAWWRDARTNMIHGFRALDPAARVPWFGPTTRLKHVAHLGVRARAFSYSAHGMSVPDEKVTVRLGHGERAGILPRGHSTETHRRHRSGDHRPPRRRVDVDRSGVRRASRRWQAPGTVHGPGRSRSRSPVGWLR